jgi:hypothetical protein
MFDNKKQKINIQRIRGIATLPTVLLLSGILMEIAITGVVLATMMNNASTNRRFGTEALAAARAGAQDGIMNVYRNNDFSSPGYSLDITDRASAQVVVCKASKTVIIPCDTPDCDLDGNCKDEIISIGTVSDRKKKVIAVLGVDKDTGRVQIKSFEEVSF